MVDLTESQVKKNIKTYNSCASRYSDQIEWNYIVSKKVEELILRPFLLEVSDRVVGNKVPRVAFMGCGTGRNIFIAKKFFNCNCVGIDISPKMVEIAKSKVGDDTLFIVEDIKSYKPEANTYDAVFAESVLSYIKRKDAEKVIKNFYRMLVPRGVTLLGFKVNGEEVHSDFTLGLERCYLTYSTEYLSKLLKKVGFSIISMQKSKDPMRDGVYWCDFLLVK